MLEQKLIKEFQDTTNRYRKTPTSNRMQQNIQHFEAELIKMVTGFKRISNYKFKQYKSKLKQGNSGVDDLIEQIEKDMASIMPSKSVTENADNNQRSNNHFINKNQKQQAIVSEIQHHLLLIKDERRKWKSINDFWMKVSQPLKRISLLVGFGASIIIGASEMGYQLEKLSHTHTEAMVEKWAERIEKGALPDIKIPDAGPIQSMAKQFTGTASIERMIQVQNRNLSNELANLRKEVGVGMLDLFSKSTKIIAEVNKSINEDIPFVNPNEHLSIIDRKIIGPSMMVLLDSMPEELKKTKVGHNTIIMSAMNYVVQMSIMFYLLGYLIELHRRPIGRESFRKMMMGKINTLEKPSERREYTKRLNAQLDTLAVRAMRWVASLIPKKNTADPMPKHYTIPNVNFKGSRSEELSTAVARNVEAKRQKQKKLDAIKNNQNKTHPRDKLIQPRNDREV